MPTKDLQPITKQFLTYNTKLNASNSDQRYLVVGSQNILINDQEEIRSRLGFTLQSPVGTTGLPIVSSTEWEDSTGDDYGLRAYNLVGNTVGVLEVLINGNWETLIDSLTSVALSFDPYWDDTEKQDRLLWVDGSTNMYDWGGGVAKLASITASTITLQGTKTFGQLRFLITTSPRAIRIKDDNGTWHRTVYTGGEGTTTLTGLGTDLTAFPFSGGNLIVQEVITYSNNPDATFNADFLRVIDNQVWVGSRTDNKFYVSKNTSVVDYTFSTPRAVGEGVKLTLDGPGRAVDVLRGDVILHAGMNFVYKSVFNQITVGTSLAETVKVVRIKTTSRQAAQSQNLLCNIGNGLVWIGADNVLYELLDATLAYNPDLRAVSDPIKPDFDATDFTNGHIKFFKTRVYISAPNSTVDYIYEYRLNNKQQKEWFWQAPLNLPVQCWTVISGLIHGHSSDTNETYKLFDGLRDNGKPILQRAILARWNGGQRDLTKGCNEMFNEGGIRPNTKINVSYSFDLDGGVQTTINKIIDGSNSSIIYDVLQDPSLGNLSLAEASLAGDNPTVYILPKFRNIHEINEMDDFLDYGVVFETNDIDQQWSLLAHGNNATLSTSKLTAIKS